MKTIKQLIADLKSDDKIIFRAVLELQTRVNPDVVDEHAVKKFIALLEDDNPVVRECSAVSLGNIGDPRAIKPLIKALGDPYDDYEWRPAVQAKNSLVQIGGPAVEFLIDALDDPDKNIRFGATQALMRIKDKRAIKPIEEKLVDSYELVHWQAAAALGIIGDESSISVLERVRKEDKGMFGNLKVSDAAKRAIKIIKRRHLKRKFSIQSLRVATKRRLKKYR